MCLAALSSPHAVSCGCSVSHVARSRLLAPHNARCLVACGVMSRAALRRLQAQSYKRVRVQQLPAPRPQSRAAGVVSDGGCRGCWLSVTPLAALAPHPHAPHHRAVIAATSYRSPLHRLPRHAACGAVSQHVFCSWRDTAASSTAPLPPHNFSRAAVRDVDVWPRSLRLRRRHVAARAAGALLPRRAPAAAAAPCMSLCTLPCPAPSRSIKVFTARLHRTAAHHGGKGGSRAALPLRHLKTWTTRNAKGNERGEGRKEG